jgi:hypothetical protein
MRTAAIKTQLNSIFIIILIKFTYLRANLIIMMIIIVIIVIIIYLGEIGWGGVDWIDMAQDRNPWRDRSL